MQDDLWIVRPDGTGRRRLTTPDQRGEFPVWAPDGRHLAFGIVPVENTRSNDDSAPSRIVIFDLDRSSRELPGKPAGGWMPAGWSPDSSKLLVDIYQEDTGWIASVDTANGTVLRLSKPPDFLGDSGVGWSPDGSAVLFRRGDGDFSNLWVVRADGTDPHLVVTGATEAVWGPPAD